jgi:nucleotide sugar dehydrogenase
MIKVSSRFADHAVCVVGLGYVGLTLAAVMADRGFRVLGVEIRDDVLARLGRGEPHFHEPGLAEQLQHGIASGRLSFAKHIPEDCPSTVFIITVGTPLDAEGRVRLDMIENVTREVAGRLKHGDMVIMRSTVKLGTTRSLVRPILQATGKRFDLAFCPERTLEGHALGELRRLPQIVGADSFAANVRAAQLFQFITPTVVSVSSAETAEMVKMVDNAFRDVSFAYANEIARIADAVGISAAEVIRAGKLGYARTNLPLPGPVGGPCLSKDPHILVQGAAEFGVTPDITITARRVNEGQPEEVAAHLARMCADLPGFAARPVIAILGLAFKGRPATDDLRGTMARPILEALRRRFPQASYRGYDAVVPSREIAGFGIVPCDSLGAALSGASLAVICNNHPVFAALPLEQVAAGMARPGLIYDFWNNYTAEEVRLPAGIGYAALGSHGRAVLPQGAPEPAAS